MIGLPWERKEKNITSRGKLSPFLCIKAIEQSFKLTLVKIKAPHGVDNCSSRGRTDLAQSSLHYNLSSKTLSMNGEEQICLSLILHCNI